VIKAALIGLVAAVGAGAAVTVAVTAGTPNADQVVVTNLVDGDTFDAAFADGRSERIRMLNIDTPETKDPDQDVECLGVEAAEHLASLLPVGTRVALEYDEDRTDSYGRTLAGVFAADRKLINAEMARAGLAVPIVVGGNDRFYPLVLAARDEAAAQNRGLYSAEVACTLPGQLHAAAMTVSQAPSVEALPANASSVALAAATKKAAAAIAAAAAVEELFHGDRSGHIWAAFGRSEQDELGDQAVELRQTAQLKESQLNTARAAAERREAAAAEATPQGPSQTRETGTTRGKSKSRPEPDNSTSGDSAPRAPDRDSTPSSANPYPGYTGPRCYAPGGKTWKPC
jgi:micrococcal nuclease